MMPFRSTKLMFWFSACLALASLALYAVLWFIFTRERARVSDAAAALTDAEQSRVADAALRALLAETAEKRAQADARFVGRDGTVAFLKELERIGADAGANTKVVTVAKKENIENADALAAAGLEALTIAIEASGSFGSAHRFLALLERMPRPLSVRRASFAQGDTGIWNGIFELEVLKIR